MLQNATMHQPLMQYQKGYEKPTAKPIVAILPVHAMG
jgi:hypothetical protein